VSVAPFSELARRYGDDLAILWIDSHPDVGTPQSTPATTQWPSLRSPVTVTPTCWSLLPATVSPDRVALVGLHSWSDDDLPNVAEWGTQSFSPDELRENTRPVLDWLASTGCTRVAIHFDVDTIESNEIVLGLGAEPGGLTSGEVRRIITDIDGTADIVGFTIAEFIPPTSDAPATTPQRLPADLRNEGRLTCVGNAISWRRTSQSPLSISSSGRSIIINRGQWGWADCTVDGPRRQYRGRSALKDDPLLPEGVSQLSRFGEVGACHIELQQFDAQVSSALL